MYQELQPGINTDLLQAYIAVHVVDPKSIASWNNQFWCHIIYLPYLPKSLTEAQLTVGNRSHLLSSLPPVVLKSLNLLKPRAGANAALWWE